MLNAFANVARIPAPVDATQVAEWVDEHDLGMPGRWFRGTERTVAPVRVVISGWQEFDGSTVRRIGVSGDIDDLDAAAARKLAAALLDAADKLDQFAQ